MGNNVEIPITATTDKFEAGVSRSRQVLRSATGEMQQALDLLGVKFDDVGKEAQQNAAAVKQNAAAMNSLRGVIQTVAAAEMEANAVRRAAKAALSSGAIDLQQYRSQLLETRTALSLVKAEYGRSVAAVRAGNSDVVGSAGAAKFGLQDLGFQLSDVATQFAGGTRAAVIFAQQGPQIVQAVTMMSNGTSGFAKFMSGGWGAGIMVGVAVLGALAAKFGALGDETEKALDKLKKDADQTEATRAAKELFKHTEQGVTAAIRDQREALTKQIDGLRSEAERTRDAAKANLEHELSIRRTTKALLEQAAAHEQSAQFAAESAVDPNDLVGSQEVASHYRDRQRELADRIREQDAQIRQAQQNLTNAQSFVDVESGKRAVDPAAQINRKYDDLITKARARAVAEGKVGDALQRQVAAYEKMRKADLQAVQDAKTSGSTSAQANLGDMTSLISSLFPGARITSTNGGRHVAGSDHYKDRAIDFVPAGGMGRYSKAQVEKILEDAGVTIRRNAQGVKQFFGPGDKGHSDHFHVAWSGSASPEEAVRRMQQARDKEAARAKAFADQSAALDVQLLAAKRANTADAAQLAQLARDQVHRDELKVEDDVKARVATGDYTDAQAKEVIAKAKQVEAEQLITINRQEALRLAQVDLDNLRAANDNQRDLLQVQDTLATTAAERRRIGLRLLELDRQEEVAQIKKVLATSQDADERKRAADRLSALPAIYGDRQQVILNQTMSPGQNYLKQLRDAAADVNAAFEQIQVDGLKNLNDGITDAIMGAKSLGDVFKHVADQIIADLVRIAVQKYITAPLANALGLGGGSGGVLSGLGSVLGLGGSGNKLGIKVGLDGFAVGTSGAPSGYAWVGERGPELVKFRGGEQVISNDRIQYGGGGGGMPVQIVPSPYFDVVVDGRVMRAAPAIADGGAKLAGSRSARAQSRSLVA